MCDVLLPGSRYELSFWEMAWTLEVAAAQSVTTPAIVYLPLPLHCHTLTS